MIPNKLPIKKLVDFRSFTERKKSNFAETLKRPKEPKADKEEQRHYWVRSLSGLITAYRTNDNEIIKERLELLLNDLEKSTAKKTRLMYQRNLNVLYNFEDFNFSVWQPIGKFNFVKNKASGPINIKGIPIKTTPNHVFTFGEKDNESIGAIKFVAQLDGFELNDLGIFSEATFLYLQENYSNRYHIDPKYCFTVDTFKTQAVTYSQVLNNEIPSILNNTIDLLIKYLK